MSQFNVDAIVELMDKEKLNQSKFAKKLGVSRACVNRIIRKQRRPSAVFLEAFKTAYPDYSLDDLFF